MLFSQIAGIGKTELFSDFQVLSVRKGRIVNVLDLILHLIQYFSMNLQDLVVLKVIKLSHLDKLMVEGSIFMIF